MTVETLLGMLYWDRPLTAVEEALLLPALPASRRDGIARLSPEKRQQRLLAYALLRSVLEAAGLPCDAELAYKAGGRPYLTEYPGIFCSLSHTQGAALAGISMEPLGVDIERIRPVSRRMLDASGTETAEAFFSLWVRREAEAKHRGQGVSSLLRAWEKLPSGELLPTAEGYFAAMDGGTAARSLRVFMPEELLSAFRK